MTHFPGTGEPPHPSNHIVAGPSLRFVNDYQSRKHASQYIRAGACILRPATPLHVRRRG